MHGVATRRPRLVNIIILDLHDVQFHLKRPKCIRHDLYVKRLDAYKYFLRFAYYIYIYIFTIWLKCHTRIYIINKLVKGILYFKS